MKKLIIQNCVSWCRKINCKLLSLASKCSVFHERNLLGMSKWISHRLRSQCPEMKRNSDGFPQMPGAGLLPPSPCPCLGAPAPWEDAPNTLISRSLIFPESNFPLHWSCGFPSWHVFNVGDLECPRARYRAERVGGISRPGSGPKECTIHERWSKPQP